jgi:hypothetical protein
MAARASVNEEQYEALKDKRRSKTPAPRIANVPTSSSHGRQKSGSGERRVGGSCTYKLAAGRQRREGGRHEVLSDASLVGGPGGTTCCLGAAR